MESEGLFLGSFDSGRGDDLGLAFNRRSYIIQAGDRDGVIISVPSDGHQGTKLGPHLAPPEAADRFWAAFGKGCNPGVERWCRKRGRILFRAEGMV